MDGPQGYILALDAGQTSTKAILARLDGGRTRYMRGGPVDHFKQEGARYRNEGVIAETIGDLCHALDVTTDAIMVAVVGWTAIRPHLPERQIAESILAELLPHASIAVVPDYVVSLAGASGGKPGIVVIAGGGSIAYGVTADGRDAVVGGLGYLLGDEGSAFDIGRRAVAAAARSSDGRDRQTALEEMIREVFKLKEVRDISHLVYAAGFSRATLSDLAPLVAIVANDGDIVAQEIMLSAGQELGRAAVAVAQRLGIMAPTVYTAGGVFRAADLVLGPFRNVVQDSMPHATVCPALYLPVVGALLLARRSKGLSDDSAWLAAVAAQCAEENIP